jgi:YVTN family beta-propeller protein
MKKLSIVLLTIFIFGLSATSYVSAEILLFEGIFERGVGIFERGIGDKGTGNKGTGKPVSQFANFQGSGGEAILEVCNSAEGEKVSSAIISINGNVVLGSSSFNQNVDCIEATVNLKDKDEDNLLEVLLKSKPGGKIKVEILQPGIPGSGDVCDGDETYPNTEIVTFTLEEEETPYGVSVTPDGNYVYVSNVFSNTVSVISTSDNTVIETIPVGAMPTGVSVSPDGKYVYVSNYGGSTVSVIQTSDNTVIKTIPVEKGIRGVSVSPDGKYVYVSNFIEGTVSVISTSDNPVIKTITVGGKPAGISVSPDGDYVYVSNMVLDNVLKGTVSVISTSEISISDNPVIEKIPVGAYGTTGVSVSPDGKYVYVSNYAPEGTVSVISICDNNTVIETIPVGAMPTGVSVSPDGKYVYVSNYGERTVSVLGFKFDDQIMNSF